jgi:glycosyltransferase involved in cell wall biosynthesis
VKISATLIVRDEASTLEACLKSIRPYVDEIVIVDTGSNDDTPKIAQAFADRFEIFLGANDAENRIEDFALARNRALQLASCEWLFWADGDDIVLGAEHLRDIAKRAKADNVQVLLPYECALPCGSVRRLERDRASD